VGFLSGLFGIGGGALMVPCLSWLFLQSMEQNAALHTAWATAMAAIVVTSLVSMWQHHQRGGVLWSVWRMMLPSVVIGVLLGTYLVMQLHAAWLAAVFALFMVYVAANMWRQGQPYEHTRLGIWVFAVAGMGIGLVSALLSIGGGTMTVPFLARQNIAMRQAVGTSAALGVPIALVASAAYLWMPTPQNLATSSGWVVWQVVGLMSLGSMLTVRYGAAWAHKLQGHLLQRLFAALLLLLAGQMLFMIG